MKRLEEIVLETIGDRQDLFLLDVMVKGHDNAKKILILLDGDNGLSIDDCSGISRKVAAVLDETNAVKGKYTLEVSSPGVDTPLKFPRQYSKNIGRKLKLQFEGNELQCELLSVSENGIVLNSEKKIKNKIDLCEVEIPFEKIEKAKVLVSF